MSGIGLGQIGGLGGVGASLERAVGANPGGAERFAELLERAEAGRRAGDGTGDDEARAAAEELVAATFVQPLLAKLRETSTAAPPFAPGIGEKTFGPLLDAEISTRIVRASSWGLVDRITEGFNRGGPAPASHTHEEAGDAQR